MKVGIYDHVANEVNEDSKIKAAENGNSKVGGITVFNLLAGSSPYIRKDGTVLTTYPGTCGGCCEQCEDRCYARAYIMRQHNTCLPCYIRNTEIMRRDLMGYINQIVDICKATKNSIARYHASGEFESLEQMIGVEDVAIRVPHLQYYFYTERHSWLEKIEESGGFSKNVAPTVSIWYTDGKRNYQNPYHFHEFIVDDGSMPELDGLFHCPAVFIDGSMNHNITCQQCKRCPYAKKGMKTAVYAHGANARYHREGVDVKAVAKQQKAKWANKAK